jgi:hypothetical protein
MEVGKMPAQRKTNQSRGLTAAGLIAVTAATLLMMAWAIFPTAAQATHVQPTFFSGNPGCGDLGDPDLTSLTKFEPVSSGTQAGVTITVDDALFDWTSQIGIDAVIVKGGSNANVYFYDEATSDTDLHAPINPNNNKPFGLSHIEFCIDEDVTTTPTTTTTTPTTTTTTPTTTTTTPTTTTTTPTTTTPGGGGGGGTTTTAPPTSTTTTTPPTVAPTTIHNTSTTATAEVLPTTVRPGKLAFTGIEDVVPIGALALTLMTTGSGLLWAGSRRRRHDGSEDED